MRASMRLDEILDRHELAPIAWEAALGAARFLVDERPDSLAVHAKSSPTDAVTEMDRGAEVRIIDSILRVRPDDGVLGEEGGEREGSSGIRWVIDPLDGTVNYTYHLPQWGVSIAAETDGRADVGVVVTPMLGESAIAIRGSGSWLVRGDTAVALAVRECRSLSTALIATGFGYRREARMRQGEVVAGLLGSIRDIRRSGSAVVDFLALASGRLDGYYESGLNRWDIAAGALIASEAGALVGALHSGNPHDGVMVASVAGIAEELQSVLRALDAA